jgi:hypothetical protein
MLSNNIDEDSARIYYMLDILLTIPFLFFVRNKQRKIHWLMCHWAKHVDMHEFLLFVHDLTMSARNRATRM